MRMGLNNFITILHGPFNGLYMVDEFGKEESSEFLIQGMGKWSFGLCPWALIQVLIPLQEDHKH